LVDQRRRAALTVSRAEREGYAAGHRARHYAKGPIGLRATRPRIEPALVADEHQPFLGAAIVEVALPARPPGDGGGPAERPRAPGRRPKRGAPLAQLAEDVVVGATALAAGRSRVRFEIDLGDRAQVRSDLDLGDQTAGHLEHAVLAGLEGDRRALQIA